MAQYAYPKSSLQNSTCGYLGQISEFSGLFIFNKCSNSKESNADLFIYWSTNSCIYSFMDSKIIFPLPRICILRDPQGNWAK